MAINGSGSCETCEVLRFSAFPLLSANSVQRSQLFCDIRCECILLLIAELQKL